MNKFYKIFLIPSSIVTWLTLYGYNAQKLVIFILCGFCTGICAYIFPDISKKNDKIFTKITEIIFLLIITSFICYFSANYLFNILFNTSETTSFINNIPYGVLLDKPLYKYVLALLQVPFVYFIINNIYKISFFAIVSLNFRKLISILKLSLKPQNVIKKGIIILLLLLDATIIGTFALILAFNIPTENIETNINDSAKIVFKYNEIHPVLYKWCNSRLDNFTDSLIMLETVYYENDSSIVEKALMIYHYVAIDTNPAKALINHYIYHNPFDSSYYYARYWNGGLIITKPLFNFFNYNIIRTINGFIQVFLFLSIIYLFLKRQLKHYILPYIIVYLMLMPIVLALNFNFSSCYYIFSFGTILLLITKDKYLKNISSYIFLLIGILTAYFDILTYPMSTFGIPILIYLLLINESCFEEKLYFICRNLLYWITGYAGMWISKWIVASLFASYEYSDAINQIIFRASKSNIYAQRSLIVNTFDGIYSQFERFLFTPVSILAFVYIIYNIYQIKKNKININKTELCKIIFPYLIVAILPILWYGFTTNHSIIHAYYTNKSLSITMLALLFAIQNIKVNTKKSN